jgi:hypothetical protein
LIPSSMVGCMMRSATRKNGQNGTDRSTGPDRNRSRRMSRVRPHPAARARTPSCSGRTSATTHASRPIRSWASDRRGAAAGWEIIPEFQHPEWVRGGLHHPAHRAHRIRVQEPRRLPSGRVVGAPQHRTGYRTTIVASGWRCHRVFGRLLDE